MKVVGRSEAEKLPPAESLPKRVSLLAEAPASGSVEGAGPSREIRLANVRAKVKALSGKNFRAFDAITDLIAEASLNKASLLDARRAPLELVKLLSLPNGQRRAVTYRDLCELGRNLHLPSWHGSERRHLYVWYHCLHRLRLVEVESGAMLMRQGDGGENAYWLLTGTLEEHRTGPPKSPPLRSKLSHTLSICLERHASMDDGGVAAAAAAAAGHPPGAPPAGPAKPQTNRVKLLERLGQEALQSMPYDVTVEATSPCQVAALSRADYQAVVAQAARESFEGLRAMASLIANKPNRHPKAISDLTTLLSVTEMFRSMDPEFCSELCGLLEFLALPEGTTIFEEGDKVDFTYLILKGEVVLSRYNESRNMSDDFAVKTTGQQFGSLSALQMGAAAVAAGGTGGGAAAVAANAAAAADKRRNFSARCTQLTEFAIVTKVAYTRLLRGQLQKSLNSRLQLLQGMAIMSNSTNQSILTRIAINCQDETFSAGTVLVDPSSPPSRLFFIVEGQAKMLWVADSPGQMPPSSDRSMDPAAVGGSASMSGGGPGSGPGMSTDGSGMASLMRDGRSFKRKQQPYVYELALLSRGDVVNGMLLHGKSNCFTVVAATNLKVMSLEVAGGQAFLEQLFGREQTLMLRELVLLQSEVHRERAAHMVAVRQSSAAMMDHRVGTSAVSPNVAESATFLQHYVPKTPGVDNPLPPPLSGYAAAISRASLFVPGAEQHGDVMKLVAAAGQSALDNLAPPTAAPPPPPLRRGGGGGGTSSGAASGPSTTINGGGGGGASFSSQRFGHPPPSKQASRDHQAMRDQQHQKDYAQQLQQAQQQQAAQQQAMQQQLLEAQEQAQHVTTVVGQPVAIPRTRMRVHSPGMARELGLEAPPPTPPLHPASLQSVSSPNLSLGAPRAFGELDRVSSLGLLPDPAGGKSRNGRPRAPHRTHLGMPFAGNVAMLVLENHSDLVKVVKPLRTSLNCVATLRQPNNVSYCDDDGQCDDGPFGRDDDGSYGSVGHSVMVFSAEPVTTQSGASASDPSSLPNSVSQTPLMGYSPPYTDGAASSGDPTSSPVAGDEAADYTVFRRIPQTVGSNGGDGTAAMDWPASSPLGTAGRTDGAEEERGGALTPFSSMPLALVAMDSDLYVKAGRGGGGGQYGSRSHGGGSTGAGNESISGGGSGGDPSWRAPSHTVAASQSSYTMGNQSGSVMHAEPLTLAASQSALLLHQSSASQLAAGSFGAAAAGSSSSQSAASMPSARATAAIMSSSAIPLAAGQTHVPLASVYRRMAPAPGASGTAGAMLTPVVAATAVVQPVVSAETAKLCSSRRATIMSTGPLAAAAAEAAASAAANASAARAALAAAMAGPCSVTSASLPPSRSPSYTQDYGNQTLRLERNSSPVLHYSGGGDASPPRLPGAALAAAAVIPDSVVILPRMVVYETALIDATAAAAAGGPGSPRGSGSPRSRSVRLESLGPAAASAVAAAAAAASAADSVAGSAVHLNAHSTHILPALPGSPGGSPSSAPPSAAAAGGLSDPSRMRPPPRMLRSMDTAMSCSSSAPSRELLGYYSSNPRMATDSEDGGMLVFTGGIGGRSVRYGSGSPGGQRRQGGGAAAMQRFGVSLRDLAGVNGIHRGLGGRSTAGRSAPLQKAQEGPDLPLELDTEAPSLQNRKLSEPSLDDLKYILSRWSIKWSQERKVVGSRGGGGEGPTVVRGIDAHKQLASLAVSYPMPYPMSEPGSPLRGSGATVDLSRYGYTSDDLYRMAKEQAEAVGVGAFKRPLKQLDLFGLPYIGLTPRPDAATLAGGGADGGGGGQLTNRGRRTGG